VTKSLLRTIAAALALAAPASAHLLTRGIPLSELAATSPAAVIARVASTAGEPGARAVALDVEQAVLGDVAPGPLRFAIEGHHPPEYAVGSRVLVFLDGSATAWRSRQTALDVVEMPARAAERDALVTAVRGYAGLRAVRERGERIAQLKTFALQNLDSASGRVRHEALLDLMALSEVNLFDAQDVARVTRIACAPETPATLAPGLVVLLAAIRAPESGPALVSVMKTAANPQARARAARVVGMRRDPKSVPALREALRDPALEVRLTAQRALEQIDAAQRRS
jgi:hypothetical protein